MASGQIPFSAEDLAGLTAESAPAEDEEVHAIVGGGERAPEAEQPVEGVDVVTGASTERLDELAYRYFGDPAYWRALAALNGIDDPLHLVAGSLLRVMSLPALLEML
jgi:nucleoid-associated protein YgaU